MSYSLNDLVEYNELDIIKKIKRSKTFCRVLLCLNLANPSMTAKEVSFKLRMDISQTRNILYTLESYGLVEKRQVSHKLVSFFPLKYKIKEYIDLCLETLGIVKKQDDKR